MNMKKNSDENKESVNNGEENNEINVDDENYEKEMKTRKTMKKC